MKVWFCGGHTEMKIGQRVTVFKSGLGHSTYGEGATLEKATARNLVFNTDSGVTVKTAIDNLHKVSGKAGKAGWNVSARAPEEFTDFHEMPVIL